MTTSLESPVQSHNQKPMLVVVDPGFGISIYIRDLRDFQSYLVFCAKRTLKIDKSISIVRTNRRLRLPTLKIFVAEMGMENREPFVS